MNGLKLISTDFDGTLFAEFEDPPIPVELQEMIAGLQAQGVKWVINTGREMASLMEALGRAKISIEPDYLVLVEREIYCFTFHVSRFTFHVSRTMSLQDQYDDAMFEFSTGNYDAAIAGLQKILESDPAYFDAQLALGMAYYRKGDYATAITEGHKAEKLRPNEQLVHTNLSLFYMKAGDKKTAEHHGLQARIASWKADKSVPGQKSESELEMAKPPTPNIPPPQKFPDMPWKKK